jgi:hypothetical protein
MGSEEGDPDWVAPEISIAVTSMSRKGNGSFGYTLGKDACVCLVGLAVSFGRDVAARTR